MVGWATSFSYTVIDYPNALTTGATGINDIGQIVGDYQDDNDNYHGFLLSGGTYTTIDYPGALQTNLFSINNSGTILGRYTVDGVNYSPFLYVGSSLSLVNENQFTISISAGQMRMAH
jgi:probable HAF family extracellular repeat protein